MLFIISFLIVSAQAEFNHEIHEKYVSMPGAEFVEYFNGLNLTWKIKEYDEKRAQYHCSFINHDMTYPVVKHDVSSLSLPDNFDAREKWSQCASISKIYDQGSCGSCWTFGAATTASDRSCIHANVNVDLSEQDLSCCTKCFVEKPCDGGNPQEAFNFWIDSGLVTSDCLPYDTDSLNANTACTKKCVNGQDYDSVKNYGGKVYAVSADEEQIKAELYNNGPIEATFDVFTDFLTYSEGVYVHTHGDYNGSHSIRMIGYGVENGVNYWLLANSWGTDHGENGLYKIKTFQPDLHLEDKLLTVMPKGS